MIYINDNPISLLESSLDVISLYFEDDEVLLTTDCMIMMKDVDSITPSKLSIGGAYAYHLFDCDTKYFQMSLHKRGGHLFSFNLQPPFEYLSYQMAFIDAVANIDITAIMQYISLHCVIKWHAIPTSINMDKHLGSDSYDVNYSIKNPYELVSWYLKNYLKKFKNEKYSDIRSIKHRIELLIEFLKNFTIYVPI